MTDPTQIRRDATLALEVIPPGYLVAARAARGALDLADLVDRLVLALGVARGLTVAQVWAGIADRGNVAGYRTALTVVDGCSDVGTGSVATEGVAA
ncbi:MAG: hypothetical protein ACOH10_11280 [Rhodoglobus sp.]